MQEVGRYIHGEEESYAGGKEAPLPAHTRVEEIPMSRTGVGRINAALRERLVAGLGEEAFDQVYRLLRRRADTGDTTDPKTEILRIVKDKRKLTLCFEVDVLIWQEQNYRATKK